MLDGIQTTFPDNSLALQYQEVGRLLRQAINICPDILTAELKKLLVYCDHKKNELYVPLP